ncbi:MAG TPA: hypothetical protein VNN18_00850 [Candidatus Xenobia bacterium]|nr:hypothetical protein [Candidatus Xenobia bacterium]
MRKAAGILTLILFAAGFAWAQNIPANLAEAARKAREERAKTGTAKVKMYTNDSLPRSGGLSIAGTVAAPATSGGEAAAAEGEGGTAAEQAEKEKKCDEACWKAKFAEKRKQIKDAETELDVLQREYNLARTQYYQDPNAAMREQYSSNTAGGRELQDLLNRINNKKREIEELKQQLSALEDDLRKSGGQPGWARP